MARQAEPSNEALIPFDEAIRIVDIVAVDEIIVDPRSFHCGEHLSERMQNLRRELMDQVAVPLAVARERAEHMRGDVGVGADLESCLLDVSSHLRQVGGGAKVGVQKFSAIAQDAMDGLEECLLSRIAVRGFDVDDRVEVVFGEVERLRVASTEVNAERAVRLAVVFDGFLILVNGDVGFGFVIAFDERRPASVPATDFEHALASEVVSAGNMVIELDRGAVDLILGLEFHRLAFGGPEAVVQKCDGRAADAAREVLVPMFPKELLEGGHKSP